MHALKYFWVFVLVGCSVSVPPLPIGSCEGSTDSCGAQSTCKMTEDGLYRCIPDPPAQSDLGLQTDSGSPVSEDAHVNPMSTDAELPAEPNCTDGLLNQDESDVDCGGPCVPCDNNKACMTSGDCLSTICRNQICVERACDDSIRNGQESDVDCGGGCEPCEESQHCNSRSDCLSGVCVQGLCTAPSCDDLVLNGSETNVDCGGNCPQCIQCDEQTPCSAGNFCSDGQCIPQLNNGQACLIAEICQSGYCANGYCCDSGDCCDRNEHCAGLFDAPAQCDSNTECRGHRTHSICQSNQCASNEVPDDSACDQDVIANECGPYASVQCDGSLDQTIPTCPADCVRNSDCDGGYRCENSACTVDLNLADGAHCTQSADCQSGHCQNGFCCASGECCSLVTDCAGHPGAAALCTDASTCTGSRTDVTCTTHMCTTDEVEDDSACTNAVIADQCGLYPAARCNGETTQAQPGCAVTCTLDDECDSGAWCNSGTCSVMLQQPNGDACTNSENCASGHCQNGYCCDDTGADCCSANTDCPAITSTGALCDDVATCQGSRLEAACQNNECRSASVPDDSGCANSTANTCGAYQSTVCSGEQSQIPPMCSSSCTDDNECDANAHCDESVCILDLSDGQSCDENSDCVSGHCQNGFCCNGGDCCGDSADCPAQYSNPPECTETTTCQGSRLDAICTNQQCASVTRPDDSACDSRVKAKDCGRYKDITCNGQTNQTPENCATRCESDSACALGFVCLNSRCFWELDDMCSEGRDCDPN